MRKDIKRIIEKCDVFARLSKTVGYKLLEPTKAFYPFQQVHLDTGQFTFANKNGETKSEYFVVAIDHFTKWLEVEILSSETRQNIKKFVLEQIVFRHGCPQRIITDSGLPYVS